MQLKEGDRVRFLNEVGQGEVVSLLDGRTALVRTEEGFDLPMLLQDLIVDTRGAPQGQTKESHLSVARGGRVKEGECEGPLRREDLEPKDAGEAKVSSHIPLVDPLSGVQQLTLGFASECEEDVVAGPFRLYAINQGQRYVLLTLGRWVGANVHTIFAGKVKPNSARCVGTIEAKDLFLYATMRVQAVYYSYQGIEPMRPEAVDVELKMSRFTRPGSFQANRFLKESLLCVPVLTPSTQVEGESVRTREVMIGKTNRDASREALAAKGKAEGVETVLNLQIEALSPSSLTLSVQEQLELQMRHFKREMDQALASSHARRVVAIHGLGNNQLRRAIINTLRSEYTQCRYQDVSFKEYDYGATLILLPSGV